MKMSYGKFASFIRRDAISAGGALFGSGFLLFISKNAASLLAHGIYMYPGARLPKCQRCQITLVVVIKFI